MLTFPTLPNTSNKHSSLKFPADSQEDREEQLEGLEELEHHLGWKLYSERLREEMEGVFHKVLEVEEPHLSTRLLGELRALYRCLQLIEDMKQQLSHMNVRKSADGR